VLATKLQQKNVEYQEITNIEEMEKLGIMSVPVLMVDNQLMNFTEAISWVNNQ
jgi:hypothetical protein